MSALEVRYEAVWDGASVSVNARVFSEEYGNPHGAVPLYKFPCPKVIDVEDRLEYHGFRMHQQVKQISAGVPFEVKQL